MGTGSGRLRPKKGDRHLEDSEPVPFSGSTPLPGQTLSSVDPSSHERNTSTAMTVSRALGSGILSSIVN